MHLGLQRSGVRSSRLLQFQNPWVLVSKQDLEDRHDSRKCKRLLGARHCPGPKITLDLSPEAEKRWDPNSKSLVFRLKTQPTLSLNDEEPGAWSGEVTCLRTHSCDKHPDPWTMGAALAQGRRARKERRRRRMLLCACFLSDTLIAFM